MFLYVVQTEKTAKDIDFIVNNPLLSVRLNALEKLIVIKLSKLIQKFHQMKSKFRFIKWGGGQLPVS